MKNRNILSAIISGLALTLVLLALTVTLVMDELGKKKMELNNIYESEFYSFCDSVNNLETDLGKLTVARNSAESISIINDTHSHAISAIDSYSLLPINVTAKTSCLKFLNQVCDWSNSYAKSVAKNADTDYREGAQKLYECAKQLNGKLKEIANKAHGNKIVKLSEDNLISSGAVDLDLSINGLNMEYPTLIYDGPFSDREEFVAKALENKRVISESEAVEIAKSNLAMTDIEVLGKSDRKVAVYELSGKVDGREAYACVTQKGGYVSLFLCNCDRESEVLLSEKQAEKIAIKKLEALGYHRMSAVWKNNNDGHIYINFAPVVDGIVYYTDLVKVRISLASGDIEGLEASGYVSSFTKRNYVAKITKEQARSNVYIESIESVRLAVIPVGSSERFCYEVYGTHNGEKYYVYIDAVMGEQADVLKVIGTNQGEVVM